MRQHCVTGGSCPWAPSDESDWGRSQDGRGVFSVKRYGPPMQSPHNLLTFHRLAVNTVQPPAGGGVLIVMNAKTASATVLVNSNAGTTKYPSSDTAQLGPPGRPGEKTWVTPRRAAELLGVDYKTVLRKIAAGRLKACDVSQGGRATWRIERTEIANYIARGTNNPNL